MSRHIFVILIINLNASHPPAIVRRCVLSCVDICDGDKSAQTHSFRVRAANALERRLLIIITVIFLLRLLLLRRPHSPSASRPPVARSHMFAHV